MKRVVDIVIASLFLAAGAPVAALAAVAIRLDSAGPVLYRRRVYGQRGRVFTLYRFRSMPVAEKAAARTRIGRVLVRVSVDEWPMLWNVLRGDMSLVGPRAEEVGCIDPTDRGWEEVLSVRPGATGAALVTLRGRYNQAPPGIRLALELDYLRSGDRWRDVRIFGSTLRALIVSGNVKRDRERPL